MRVYLGTDHAGYRLKEAVKKHLRERGVGVEDLGTGSEASVDYPVFITAVARRVAESKGRDRGIVFGGTGIGECICANKIKGVRAALVYDEFTARATREHNDSNVLCLGGRTATKDESLAFRIVDVWLATPFSGDERHVRRLNQIAELEGGAYPG